MSLARKRLFALLLGLLVTFALGELLARNVQHLPGMATQLYRGGRGPASDRLGWYLLGPSSRGGGQVSYDPVLGWVPTPGSWIEQSARAPLSGSSFRPEGAAGVKPPEGGVQVSVNAAGFRGTTPTSPSPPEGRTRVLAVGDSFTFGSEAPDGTTWPERLGASRPDLDVVNLGVFAYGVDQMWLRWRKSGRGLGAKVVIIALIDDDLRRTVLDFHVYERPRIRAELGIFEPDNTPLPTWEEERARLTWTSRLAWFARIAWESRAHPDGKLAVTRASAIVDRFVEEVRADGALPLLVHLPTGWDLDQRASTDVEDYRNIEREWFLERCARRDVVCADLLPPMLAALAAGDDLTALIHYSERGNQLAAVGIDAALVTLLGKRTP